MPIQPINFPMLTREQVSPLPGIEAGQKLGQNFLMFPQELQKAMLANALNEYKRQQEAQRSQYYPQMARAELAKAEAEPKEIMARTGLLGEQQKWFGPTAQSEISLRGAQKKEAEALAGMHGIEAQMNAMKLKMLSSYLGEPNKQSAQAQGQVPVQVQGQNDIRRQQTQASVPSSNMEYGINVPQPTREDIINKSLFGIDSFTPKQQAAKEQVMNQYNEYQKEIASSVQEANAANSLNQAISIFNNAMNASFYKGSRFGHIPSSGIASTLVPGNLSPEQEADMAAMQMLPAAISTLKNAMGTARFSNLDMRMAGRLKFDRSMNDETRALQTAWVNAMNDRMQEQARFYKVMGNPKSGALKSDAEMLWAEYQNNHPLINDPGNKVLRDNLGNWPLYTTPKAIASIKKTGTYNPSKAEQNTFMMEVPDDNGIYRLMPINKGEVEKAIRRGARLP